MKLGARVALIALGLLVLLLAWSVTRAASCGPLVSSSGMAASADSAIVPGRDDVLPAPLRAEALDLRASVQSGAAEGVADRGASLIEASQAVADPRARSELLFHVGTTLELLSQSDSDARARAEAVRAFREAAALAVAEDDDWRLAWAELELSILYADAGATPDSLVLARRALDHARQGRAPRVLYRARWQIARLAALAGDRVRARRLLDEAFDDALALRRDLAFADPAAALSLGEDAERLGLELVDLLLLEAAESTGEEEQRLLSDARDRLERLKAAELRDHFGDPCLDAQRKTKPDDIPGAVVLYPVLLPDRVELIVSRDAKLQRHTVRIEGGRLAEEARHFRSLLEKRTTRQYVRPARNLYEWLIRPIEKGLDGREGVTLVVVPDRVLRTIPFAALMDARTGQYLIERVPVAVTPVLTLTEPRRIEPGKATLLAAGLGEATDGFEALTETREEVANLSEIFPGRVLLDAEFQVGDFAAAVEGSPYSIVHIASHGRFDADESRSFVLAHDGRLGMDELADMVRTTRFRSAHPLELLTLSACETAVGDDRAALGLAGVALQAGARSAVATLWSVDDRAAANVIGVFYAELATGEVSRAEALRRAQRRVRDQPQYAHPGYWAAFLLINSWL